MGKHYAISDLHGCYNIYEQVCAMLKPDDVVFFLGDAGDRGYDNWRLIKEIYNNPQWIYLKGNHEELAYNALEELKPNNLLDADENFAPFLNWNSEYSLWEYNGGATTYGGFIDDGAHYIWINRLKNLPEVMRYTNINGDIILLSHAGFDPTDRIKDFLWDRNHFFRSVWEGKSNEYEVHGHTPIQYMIQHQRFLMENIPKYKHEPMAYRYCEGHKINIDNGVFYTGYTVILDLDTFEAIPLYDKSGKVEVDFDE